MFFWHPKTFIMDLDTLADPRVIQFLQLGIVTGRIIVPLPPATDAPPGYVAQRAKENIQRLQQIKGIKVKTCPAINTVNDLLKVARKHRAMVITIKPEIKAAANGLPVVTTLDIFDLLRPGYLPGTVLKVKIAKKGKEKNEGIAYLEGGIKVVVENAGNELGKEIEVVVQGSIDTDIGQVLFARPRFIELR